MNRLDITNRALLRLGADPIGNINDPSKQARAARTAFIPAAETVLRIYEWPRVVERVPLVSTETIAWKPGTGYISGDYCVSNGTLYRAESAGTSDANPAGPGPTAFGTVTDGGVTWSARCLITEAVKGYPYSYLMPACIRLAEVIDARFVVFGDLVYTSNDAAEARVLRMPPDDVNLDPLLTEAVALKLAYYLAPAVGMGKEAQSILLEYQRAEKLAKAAAGSESRGPVESEKLWTEA